MVRKDLLSRRDVLAVFGTAGMGVLGVDAQSTDSAATGDLIAGGTDMAGAYQVGEGMWKGPLSVRSEVPKEDGNDFLQTDAGDNGDMYAVWHYNGGWSRQGFDLPSSSIESVSSNVAAQRAEYYIRETSSSDYQVISTDDKSIESTETNIDDALQYAVDNVSQSHFIEIGAMDATTGNNTVQLSSKSELTIRGQGKEKTYIRAGGGNNLIESDSGSDVTGLVMSNMTLSGDGNSCDVLKLKRRTGVILRDMVVRNGERGVVLNEVYNALFEQVRSTGHNANAWDCVQYGVNEVVFNRCVGANSNNGLKITHDGTGAGPRGVAIINFNGIQNDVDGILLEACKGFNIINPYTEENGNDGIRLRERKGEKCESVDISGGWHFNENPAIGFRGAKRCSQESLYLRREDGGTTDSAVFLDSGSVDCNIDEASNSLDEQNGTISKMVDVDSPTRPRNRGVIGGGSLGGVDLSSVNGQFEGDRAVANGSSTNGNAYGLGLWDLGNTQWRVHNPDATQ